MEKEMRDRDRMRVGDTFPGFLARGYAFLPELHGPGIPSAQPELRRGLRFLRSRLFRQLRGYYLL